MTDKEREAAMVEITADDNAMYDRLVDLLLAVRDEYPQNLDADELLKAIITRQKASAERIETLEALVGRYEAMMKAVEWIQFDNGQIEQPCDQEGTGRECWHVDHFNRVDLYDSALEAFESLGKDATTTTEVG